LPCFSSLSPPQFTCPYTDKKENQIFLTYKEIQSGAVAKSYMRKGFLIYEETRKYFPIYEEAVSQIWFEFPYMGGKFDFLFYQCTICSTPPSAILFLCGLLLSRALFYSWSGMEKNPGTGSGSGIYPGWTSWGSYVWELGISTIISFVI
jgi:hypothetical protein